MKNTAQEFEDFLKEQISKKEQKTVRGGDGGNDPNDPGKKTGTGNG